MSSILSSTSLKKLAFLGTVWTIFCYGVNQVLRFGSSLILTRLLMPELFGQMALIQVFMGGLSIFSDIGINPSIIQSDRGDDPVFLNTAWTIQVIRGFGLWICCLILALPIANYFNEPRLLWLIPIVGLHTIICGFNSTSLASLNRHMEVGKIARFELGFKVISMLITIVWALISPTIWALVGGNLISILLMAIWTHRLNPQKPNHFAWNKEVFYEITSFSKWIFMSTVMTFLASQADRILLSKFFSLKMLGVYVVAFNFADVPRKVSQKVGIQVIFPTISQLIDLPRRALRVKILRQRWNILLCLILIVTVLVSFGDLVIVDFYDSRYEQAAWMLPILALGLWPLLLSLTLGTALIAIGKPTYTAVGNCLKFVYLITLLPLAFFNLGVVGAVIVVALKDIPFYATVNFGLWREKLSGITQDIQATILLFLSVALTLTIRYIMGFGIPFDNILPLLSSSFVDINAY